MDYPAGIISSYVNASGRRTHFLEAGNGEPLVLVHGSGPGASAWSGYRENIAELAKHFHVYAIEWDKSRIDFFMDGKKVFTYENEGMGEEAWPFDGPQYLLLNLAIGGEWGGQKGIDESIFPQRLEIDYVRVYQKKAGK